VAGEWVPDESRAVGIGAGGQRVVNDDQSSLRIDGLREIATALRGGRKGQGAGPRDLIAIVLAAQPEECLALDDRPADGTTPQVVREVRLRNPGPFAEEIV